MSLLGFAFLTRSANPADLASLDMSWIEGAPGDGEERRYVLSLDRMISLRQALKFLREFDSENVDVAQLSDGAFIWSQQARPFFEAITELAKDLDVAGLMWRAGLTKGPIWLPKSHDTDLGKFLAGSAVTRAVQLESRLKGARIAADFSLRDVFLTTGLGNQEVANMMFAPTDDPLAFEYRWYLAPWRNGNPMSLDDPFERGAHEGLADLAASRAIDRIARLATRREYDWNGLNVDGLLHRVATIVSTASAITAAKGPLSLRISDPTEVRRILLLNPQARNMPIQGWRMSYLQSLPALSWENPS